MSNQPIKNQQYIFYITLVSRSTGQWQVNPTIAAGDFKVSTDGGSYNNLGTLPVVDPAGSRSVKVTLSASEMNGSNVNFQGVDVAGNEWDDVFINAQPVLWLNTDDVVRADLKQIDEQATNGNNAVLKLKMLDIQNTNDSAVFIGTTNDFSDAIDIFAGKAGAAVWLRGGDFVSGSSAGEGLLATGGAGGNAANESAASGIAVIGGTGGAANNTAASGIYVSSGNDGGAGGWDGVEVFGTGAKKSITAPQGIIGSDSEDLSVTNITDKVWDEATAGHATAGTTGKALTDAGSAGDPWGTSLPGAYGAGTAGKIIGDNLNATVSSRSSHSAADVWAVGSRTLTSFGTLIADIWVNATRTITGGTLDASYDPAKTAAQVSDIPTANDNADALLKRDWNSVTGEAARSVLNALRKIRNKVSFNGVNTLTITKEDDATPAYTQGVVEDASQDPFKEVG